jgi:putative oxidoreductase
MSTHVAFQGPRSPARDAYARSNEALRFLVPIGRALFALIFIAAAFGHFSSETIAYARHAGVPLANVAVPLSGVLSLIGGILVLLGYHARIGAWLIVLFLVPVTLTMHAFWAVPDPMMARMQQAMFLKNLSMLGGALLLAYFGAGPISLDARQGR